MSKRPKLRLSRLRDIGWSLWDPMGLKDEGVHWKDLPNADEYDTYLLRAAGMIRQGETLEDVTNYLVQTDVESTALERAVVTDRAKSVVIAIRDDKHLWSDGGETG